MDDKQLAQWLEAFVDGSLTEMEADQLAQLLRQDKATLSQFRQELAFVNLLGHLFDDIKDDDDFSRAFWERVRAEDSAQEFTRCFKERRAQVDRAFAPSPCPQNDLWEAVSREQKIKQRAQEALERFKLEEERRAQEQAYKQYLAQRRAFIVGASALVILIAILLLALLTPKPTPEESIVARSSTPVAPPLVATIVRSVDAQWDRLNVSVGEGTRLAAAEMRLQQGLMEIAFDEGAEVILQAPCAFRLNGANSMYLRQGIVSAFVPERALGFEIETVAGVLTDYGTEFGVVVHEDGETEAHVSKGKVELANGRSSLRHTTMLTEGQAGAVGTTGTIERKPFHLTRFVYSLEHATHFGIPGKRLNLADIVGGGNGFGTGTLEHGINPLDGMPFTNTVQTLGLLTHRATNQYRPVSANPFVDGVFVPDNEPGPMQVSSEGHTFADFPDTSGEFHSGIMNGSYHESENVPKTYLRLSEKDYGQENPSIYLHSNKGITFDLQAIRTALPGIRIQRFTALCGTSESLRMYADSQQKTDYWVLVDGREAYAQRGVTVASPLQSIRVELQPEDRFLTLVTTDGGDGVGNDWALFAEPVLELTPEAGS